MALFALIYHYSEDADLVAAHRPEHRAYLADLFDREVLLVAGPLGEPGPPRGLLVLDVESEADVRAIAHADPFTTRGVILEHSIGAWALSFGANRLPT
ncbi:YciI family protein [Nocardioides sp. AX2bis]|uniref:YciI family protein n=1 Tax=Nocardioides sp. AX2bis TaxID=2653157 RepID=UPI0012EF1840|nr:YciI family protein [Nocardioides sp. AX2bis]VXC25960.1 conserved hypothetical protein [Nocardioides sp. AX2bis]